MFFTHTQLLRTQIYKSLGRPDEAVLHLSWAAELDPKGATNLVKAAIDRQQLPGDDEDEDEDEGDDAGADNGAEQDEQADDDEREQADGSAAEYSGGPVDDDLNEAHADSDDDAAMAAALASSGLEYDDDAQMAAVLAMYGDGDASGGEMDGSFGSSMSPA